AYYCIAYWQGIATAVSQKQYSPPSRSLRSVTRRVTSILRQQSRVSLSNGNSDVTPLKNDGNRKTVKPQVDPGTRTTVHTSQSDWPPSRPSSKDADVDNDPSR